MADDFDPEKLIEAMLPTLNLPVPDEMKPGVAFHLAVAEKIARDVIAFPLEDDSEPGPVFKA
ncbi:MAG: DUF4089 domain-containing protein [Pseudomonadota bacterium]